MIKNRGRIYRGENQWRKDKDFTRRVIVVLILGMAILTVLYPLIVR